MVFSVFGGDGIGEDGVVEWREQCVCVCLVVCGHSFST